MAEPLRMDYVSNDAEVIAAFKRQQAEMEKERKARVELQKQINENAAAQKAADKSATETAKAFAAEQAKLASAASKIAESVRTPLQAYKVGLSELVDHYKSGRLSQEEYLAAGDKLKEQYRDQAGITAKLEKAEKDKNEEIKSAQRIIESNLTAQQKYERNIAQITDLHKKGRLSLEQYNTAVAAEKTSLDKSSESGDKFGGVLGGLGAKVAGAAAGFASMGTVISFIKAEYDALLERQGKSADANISLAAEQEALLMNLGGADAKQVTDNIRNLSKQSSVKEENVTRAVNEAMAARGDLGVDAVVKAVGSVSKIRKFAPSEMAGLAAATIDTQKQTGLGTDESLGFLLQMQGQARTKDLKGLAENFTPAVGGVMNFGADRQTAGAMLAALSHGMGDTTGAMTATSAIQLSKQLREYGSSGSPDLQKQMAEIDKKYQGQKESLSEKYDRMRAGLSSKKMPAEARAEEKLQIDAEERKAKQELKDRQAAESDKVMAAAPAVPIGEVLSRMQKDKEYRDQFLRGKDQGGFGASFEAKALPAIESLLSGGVQAQQFDAAKKALSQDPTKALEAAVKARDLPAIDIAQQDMAFANIVDQQRLADTKGAASAVNRERLAEIRKQAGQFGITGAVQTAAEDVMSGGQRTSEQTIGALDSEIKRLESGKTDTNLLKEGLLAIATRGASLTTAGNRMGESAQFEESKQLVALLTEMRDLAKQQLADQKDKKIVGAAVARAKNQNEGGL